MTDRLIFVQDLDTNRGLAEDGKAFVKVDGETIVFDGSGALSVPRTWVYLAAHWSVEPSVVGTATLPVPGDVYVYTLGGTTCYRLVPTTYDPAFDGFYATFSGGALSDLIVSRG